MYRTGFMLQVLSVIVQELKSNFGKGNQFAICNSELQFLYFANQFQALEELNAVEARKPGLSQQQQIHNLRCEIDIGYKSGNGPDPEKILSTVQCLQLYHQFLGKIEETLDLSLRFWNTLDKDNVSAQELMEIGKKLYEKKYQIIQILLEISKINSNNLEFLIKYGIVMRYIMYDKVSAELAFNKVTSMLQKENETETSCSKFTIFSNNSEVMFFLARIEQGPIANFCDMNSEVEKLLGFNQEELVGYSITNIMPPHVAKCHGDLMKEFFSSMRARCIGIPKFLFVKSKKGYYIPCRSMKKVVPSLQEGLRVALILIKDKKLLPLISFKKEPTERRIGVLICSMSWKILGLSKDTMKLMGINLEMAKEITKNMYLTDILDIVTQDFVAEALMTPEGAVIKLNLEAIKQKMEEDNKATVTVSELFWCRIIVEENGGLEQSYIFLFSKIPPESTPNYVSTRESGSNLFHHKKEKRLSKILNLPNSRKMSSQKLPLIIQLRDKSCTNNSEASLENSAILSPTSHNIEDSMEESAVFQTTPTSIKKLIAVIIGMLLLVGALISIHTVLFLNEINQLIDRIELVKSYELRNKYSILIANLAGFYFTLIYTTESSFNQYLNELLFWGLNSNSLSHETRNHLYSQSLDYRMENTKEEKLRNNFRIKGDILKAFLVNFQKL